MKKMKLKNYFVLLLILSIGFSCSIEKRLHTGGYHVKLNKNKIKSDVKSNDRNNHLAFSERDEEQKQYTEKRSENTNSTVQHSITDQLNFEESTPVNKLSDFMAEPPKESTQVSKTVSQEECDVLYKKNGDELRLKVLEIDETRIKYKKCDNLNGPIYSIGISEVFMIKYANGTKDVFNEENETKATEVKTEPIKSVEPNQTAQSDGMSGLGVVGIVFLVVGFLLLLFISILIGLLFLILGLIFLIVGLSQG
ncbi:hypothetical protein [Brumimicrobium oceani]|uniref:Lipoprotein n=1 Tax=Brumimicrobium oceani TaxID=2100725 RepID=A0A2U2XB25_9FLAO|nr:hypothetical protein [Brumimicrobium oceani]PWH84988.1 hypothetical protein DIT68_11485 [Brumimicrobium oceani]